MAHAFFDPVRENEQRARLTAGSASSAASWKPPSYTRNGNQKFSQISLGAAWRKTLRTFICMARKTARRNDNACMEFPYWWTGWIGGGVKIVFFEMWMGGMDLELSLHTLCWMNGANSNFSTLLLDVSVDCATGMVKIFLARGKFPALMIRTSLSLLTCSLSFKTTSRDAGGGSKESV